MIELRIPDVGPSANTFYSGMHFSKRIKLVRAWHLLIEYEAKHQGIRKVKHYPVDIEVECFFGKRRRTLDADNCFPTAKLAIDSLVHCGVLAGDSLRFVSSVKFTPFRSDDGSTYTKVLLKTKVA